MSSPSHDRLLIIDFGSQVTQLIARRLRELSVYCDIHPFQSVTPAFLKDFAPKAVILSGGPATIMCACYIMPHSCGIMEQMHIAIFQWLMHGSAVGPSPRGRVPARILP